ncbi:TPA: hypothetical protein ACH3X1_014138 [Trebouxia sp. C0004]
MLRRQAATVLSRILKDQAGGTGRAALPRNVTQTRWQWNKSGEYQHFQQRTSPFGRYASKRTLTWVSFTTGGCFVIWVTNREEIPYTGRKHCILVPTSLEQSIGQNTFQQIRTEAKSQGTLLSDHHPYVKMIKRIGMKIAQKASDDSGVSGHMEHMKGLKWEFAVIDSDQVNAFVVPGGKVVVYTGLLKLLQGPAMETQLAAVLGHEIAHVVARHAAERMTQSEVFGLIRTAAYIVVGIPITAGAAAAVFFLPHSRSELDALDNFCEQLVADCYVCITGMYEQLLSDRLNCFLHVIGTVMLRITSVEPKKIQVRRAASAVSAAVIDMLLSGTAAAAVCCPAPALM